MVVGTGVDDNTCVLGVTLETAVGVDIRNVEAGVSEALAIGDMVLIERVGVGVDITRAGMGVAVGVLELVERVGVGVAITREDIGIELEEEMNIVNC